MRASTFAKTTAVVGAVALLSTGCLQNPNAGGGGGGGTGGNAYVDGGSADGDKVVTILGAFGGDEEKQFVASMAEFEKSSGIKVQYTSDQDFTTTIKQKVNAGDSPDIALFPQPGGLLEFAAQKKIQPIDTFLDYDAIARTLLPGLLDVSRYQGRVYGAPMRNANKSLIWVPKKAWDSGNYGQLDTWQNMVGPVSAKVKASNIAPWCMGWGSDQATGWVGTDWIEELVLKMYGPEVYNDWIFHRIPFNDPRIVKAFDEFAKVAKTPGQVLGGTQAITATKFGEAMTPAFATPPKCMMMKQGSFYQSFLPASVKKDTDNQVELFAAPEYAGGFKGKSVLGGGDLAALFNGNDPDSIAVMKFLSSDKFGVPWAKAGGWMSPHKTFDVANYPDNLTREVAKMANEADAIVFDGSDVMPKVIGSDVFWKQMIAWVNGQDSKTTADNIEAAWPKS
ncbi:sugar ABC transporter substrate-binding protein [Arsenicicoccus piscis]|uniref:Sugar ABC transporter substrate-binding protein n=1 Tax=Arsenicicoccus piscis TaxID=673954 RepID=A0ABQ6HIL8_9MICO|nr:extracellular solute-binding protein [Arsenicicoccus piscis]GMA18358.1 sugar ABC transporter substrate-binding protein [Arsenicicoccus piscis]